MQTPPVCYNYHSRFICRSNRRRPSGRQNKKPPPDGKPYQDVEHAVPPDFTPQGKDVPPRHALFTERKGFRSPVTEGNRRTLLSQRKTSSARSGSPLGDDFVRGYLWAFTMRPLSEKPPFAYCFPSKRYQRIEYTIFSYFCQEICKETNGFFIVFPQKATVHRGNCV